MKTIRIIVTGSRHHTDVEMVERGIDEAITLACPVGPAEFVIVHGDAPGADRIAKEYAQRSRSMSDEPHIAYWERYGKSAGPLRNQEMVDLGASIMVAFPHPDSRGTWDAIRKAVDVGIPVLIFSEGPMP